MMIQSQNNDDTQYEYGSREICLSHSVAKTCSSLLKQTNKRLSPDLRWHFEQMDVVLAAYC